MQNIFLIIKENTSLFVNKIMLIEGRIPGSLNGCVVVASISTLAIMLFVLPKLPENPILELLCIALLFFIFGCAGAIAAIQRELPQFIPLTGQPAFLAGIFLAVMGWGVVLYTFYLMAAHMLQGK